MIKKHKITAMYHVDLYCDKCGKKMSYSDTDWSIRPVQFMYQCECGYKITSITSFPYQQATYELEGVEIMPEEAMGEMSCTK
jgi:predicted RNA-binding Zn-ribbon protein involved in translation (DUF1610 family)